MQQEERTDNKYPFAFVILAVVTLVVALLLMWPGVNSDAVSHHSADVFFFLALMVFAELLYIPLPKGGGVSVSFAVILACLAIYGPEVAALVSGVGLLVALVVPSRSLDLKYAFNFGQIAIAAYLGGQAFLLAGGDLRQNSLLGNVLALLVASVVYFLANAGLVTLGCSVGYRLPFRSVWHANIRGNNRVSWRWYHWEPWLPSCMSDMVFLDPCFFWFPYSLLGTPSYRLSMLGKPACLLPKH